MNWHQARIEAFKAWLAGIADDMLQTLTPSDAWFYHRRSCSYPQSEHLIAAEQVRRGMKAMTDLRPDVRRAIVDPANLDLHALAAGPIMDIGQIYLPAGKLSMAETRQRELRGILSNDRGPHDPRQHSEG